MLKYFNTISDERGNVLPNYRLQVVDSLGAIVPIYADKAGTRFRDAGGNIVNYATARSNGRVSFYWEAAEGQVLQTLDISGDLVDSEVDFADTPAFVQTSISNIEADLGNKANIADVPTKVELAGPNAKQIAPGLTLHAKAFGCVADGVTDDSAALQAMADYAKANNIRDVYLPGGDIGLANSVYWPYGVRVHGARSTGNASRPATRIVPLAGGTFTGDYLFLFNSRNATSSEQAGNQFGGGMSDVLFDNEANQYAGLRSVIAAGHGYSFRNVGSYFMFKSIVRAPWEYSDNFRIEQCFHSGQLDANEYQVEIAGQGDCLVIDGYNAPPTNANNIWIRGDAPSTHFTYNASLRSIINGNIRNDCQDVVINDWHSEGGRLIWTRGSSTTVNSANVTQDTGDNDPRFQYLDTGGVGASTPAYLALRDVAVRWAGRAQTGAPVASDALFEVTMGQSCTLSLDNVRRMVGGSNVAQAATAIRVAKVDGVTPVENFKDYAEHLCQRGTVREQYKVQYGFSCEPYDGGSVYLGQATPTTAAAGTWSGATGTYHYQVIRLFDPVAAIGAATSTSLSATVANTTQAVQLVVFGQNRALRGVYRVYRGTSSGSYDKYADISIMGGKDPVLVDEGDRVAGVPWTSRTAGAADTYQQLATGCSFTIAGAGRIRTNEPYFVTVGDADKTLDRWATETIVSYTTTLTAERSLTAQVGVAGARVRVNRRGGAFNLKMKASWGSDKVTLSAPRSAVGFGEMAWDAGAGDWVVVSEGEDAKTPNAAIAAPSGGTTVDAEARTAIDAIRAALTAQGVTL